MTGKTGCGQFDSQNLAKDFGRGKQRVESDHEVT